MAFPPTVFFFFFFFSIYICSAWKVVKVTTAERKMINFAISVWASLTRGEERGAHWACRSVVTVCHCEGQVRGINLFPSVPSSNYKYAVGSRETHTEVKKKKKSSICSKHLFILTFKKNQQQQQQQQRQHSTALLSKGIVLVQKATK